MSVKRIRFLACTLAVTACATAWAAPSGDQAVAVARMLFARERLAAPDAIAIASQLPLKLVSGALRDDVCGEPASSRVQLLDLNNDRADEVIVVAGNACISGMSGATLYVFAKQGNGWVQVLNVGAGGYELLETRHQGWQDIALAMGGRCSPVWGMVGKEYDLVREVGQCN